MAMREWRWAAMLRLWRWRAARARGQAETWEALRTSGLLRCIDAASESTGLSWLRVDLLRAEMVARGWLAVAGGREQLAYLRRWEVHGGFECDTCRRGLLCALDGGLCGGRWAVGGLLDVQRPAQRRGSQLEVQVQWRGADPWGAPWPVEWKPLRLLTVDLRREARRIERAKWPLAATVQAQGQRRSSRLGEATGRAAVAGGAGNTSSPGPATLVGTPAAEDGGGRGLPGRVQRRQADT